MENIDVIYANITIITTTKQSLPILPAFFANSVLHYFWYCL